MKDNSLEGRDIRDETLESRDVVNGGLQSRDVRDGALRGVDINDQSLGGIDLGVRHAGRPRDRRDEARHQPAQRRARGKFVSKVRRVQTQTANDPATPKAAPAGALREGRRLLGGGARVVAPAGTPVAISTSAPRGNSWEALAYATVPTGNWQLVAYAICG